MEKLLYIIVYKNGDNYFPLSGGIQYSQRDAETIIKAEILKGSGLKYRLIQGSFIPYEGYIKEAEARLGAS